VRAIFNTSVWLQAGQCLAPAAQIPAKQKSGCCPRLGEVEVEEGGGYEGEGGEPSWQRSSPPPVVIRYCLLVTQSHTGCAITT
jgi:hypothetical protein